MQISQLGKKFGPGLLYAAAAIGVSHLVQSTRAGADFGFQLLWAVILANIVKYPFFKIGPQYTALSGNSLLSAYKKIGNWTLILFFIMTFGTMFSVQAAVTIVTGGLFNQFLNLTLDVRYTSSILLIFSAILLIKGRYNLLDNFIKIIIVILTLTTIVTIGISFFADFEKSVPATQFTFTKREHVFFLIALVGWMPAPMDIPIWHGLWSMAKNIEQKKRTSLQDALLDFNVGFITTAILACCFLALGAIVMHRSGIELSSHATTFAGQLVTMYTYALGKWSYPLISIAAFTTMLSTTLTCLDAFARILREGFFVYTENVKTISSHWYNFWVVTTVLGSIIIFFAFLENMKNLVDMATTISFLVAPVYALLNYKVMTSSDIPKEQQPSSFLKFFCFIGIFILASLSAFFVYLRFFN